MKKMHKIISFALAATVSLGILAGCGSKKKDELEGYLDGRTKKVSVVYTANAYGKEWITQIAKQYMEKHNSDTYIQLTQTVDQGTEVSKIKTGISSGDLYLLDQSLDDLVDNIESLKDVYESYALGEENNEDKKLIKDKLSPMFANKSDYAGTYDYVMPYAGATAGYGLVYNKTVLDEAFPDGYTLPRTTQELFEFGDSMKSVDLKGVNEDQDLYLMVCSFGDGNEYLQYTLAPWFAQIMGMEKFEKFMEGRYYDEATSTYKFDKTNPTVYEKYQRELEDFHGILLKLMTKSNGYVHKDSDSIDYKYASCVEAGMGYKGMMSKTAFKVDGSYFEEEAKLFLDGMKDNGQEQTMGMLKLPIASDIIKRLPTVNDDATLRSAIDYVDGVTAEKPAGVSDDDLAEVAEARGMIGVYLGGGMVVPKKASNKDGAKDFIRYLCSDEAAIIAAQSLHGMELLPYGKTVTNEELGFTRSNFLDDISKWQTMNKTLINTGNYALPYYTEFDIGTTPSLTLSTIFRGNSYATSTAWWEANKKYFGDRWETIVTDYEKGVGAIE